MIRRATRSGQQDDLWPLIRPMWRDWVSPTLDPAWRQRPAAQTRRGLGDRARALVAEAEAQLAAEGVPERERTAAMARTLPLSKSHIARLRRALR